MNMNYQIKTVILCMRDCIALYARYIDRCNVILSMSAAV